MDRWRSAVLIALPELAGWTDRWRGASYAGDHPRLPIARRVPPHVTVLVPWVADPAGGEALGRLRDAVAGFGPLELSFPAADEFPGGTVFLRPEPFGVVRELVRSVLAAFPECPPYDGEHPDPHPHVTVSADGGPPVLDEVRAAVAAEQPPVVRVDAVAIWASATGEVWQPAGEVALGG